MGVKGRQFEYRRQRDSALMASYRAALARTPARTPLADVMRITVSAPCERFWVSASRAYGVITDMRQGGNPLAGMGRNKRQMYAEINRRVQLMEQTPPGGGLKLHELVELVVEQPAPCFYMTPESAKVIICRIRKEEWYKQRLKHLRFLR